MTTRHTTERSLIRSVALVPAAADGAGSARVPWVNQDYRHALQRRLVADELAQLPKRPVAVPRSLRMLNRYPIANMRQFFQRDSSRGAFSLRNKSFADDVVGVALEAALPAAELPQSPFGAACADRLQRCSAFAIPLAALVYGCAAEGLAVAIGRKVDDAQVHAQHIINVIGRRFVYIARHQKEEHSTAIHQIAFSLPRLKEVLLPLTTDKRDGLAPWQCPDRYRLVVGLEREDTVIVGNTAVGFVGALGLAVQLVAIAHFGKASDDHLRRQSILSPNASIGQRLQRELAKGLLLPGNAADIGTRGVGSFKRSLQGVGLVRRRKELQLGDNLLHTLRDTVVVVDIVSLVAMILSVTVRAIQRQVRFRIGCLRVLELYLRNDMRNLKPGVAILASPVFRLPFGLRNTATLTCVVELLFHLAPLAVIQFGARTYLVSIGATSRRVVQVLHLILTLLNMCQEYVSKHLRQCRLVTFAQCLGTFKKIVVQSQGYRLFRHLSPVYIHRTYIY